jgi:DNA polymerase-3 subunit gamma/tau
VLGLVDDDLYAAVLQLIVERRPGDVFPLVDRLMDAGVDLAEFMAGAAEVLRGILMLQVGARPEGLTDALRATLESYHGRLDAGDVLRMLRLLADNEMGIRRSVNPRLVVETLLLRWAMLDRIVDLQQVLASGPPAGVKGEKGGDAANPRTSAPQTSQPVARGAEESRKGPPPAPVAPAPAIAAPVSGGPASIESIRAAWPAVVAATRTHSRFLGEALAATQPATLELPWLTVLMQEPNALFADRLQEEAGKVEEVLSRSLGESVRLRVTTAEGSGSAAQGRPRRMSESSLKAERLREFRSKDPALDTAADALDLEIVD